MKKHWRCLACLAAAMTGMMTIPAWGAKEMGTRSDSWQVEKLKGADQADQLILAVGHGSGPEVTVAYYVREDGKEAGPGVSGGSWVKQFEVESVYGRNGASKEKREGDGKTPEGIFGLTMAFGILPSPGSVLAYHQIQEGDFWVDDVDSSYYNRLVNVKETGRHWKSGENMIAQAPYYDYGLALDFNKECTPGAGSAIFIHCEDAQSGTEKKKTGSAGCIRLPKEQMKLLVQKADAKTKVIIVSDASGLPYEQDR